MQRTEENLTYSHLGKRVFIFLRDKKSQGRQLAAAVQRPVNTDNGILSTVFVSGLLSVLDNPQIASTDPVSPHLPLVHVILKKAVECVGNVMEVRELPETTWTLVPIPLQECGFLS